MEIVAQHLQHQAINRRKPIERDLFGRSAFNRYYYAMFLIVKEGLASLRPEWGNEIAHKSIPEVLRGKVKKELANGRNRAQRASDFVLVTHCQRAQSAAETLARMMDEGRATRVAADYAPDIPVQFSAASNFSLNTVSVHVAQAWPHKAKGLMDIIKSAWMQIHA